MDLNLIGIAVMLEEFLLINFAIFYSNYLIKIEEKKENFIIELLRYLLHYMHYMEHINYSFNYIKYSDH